MARNLTYDGAIRIRLTREMRDHVKICSAKCGTTPTEYIRNAIIDAVVRDLPLPFDADELDLEKRLRLNE